MATEHWYALPAAAVVLGLFYGLYGTRRLRDPRLDRDYSDDQAAPYDSPASSSPRMDAYMRVINDDGRAKY